eukprot:19683-Prorocentrum_lima.AAC.1
MSKWRDSVAAPIANRQASGRAALSPPSSAIVTTVLLHDVHVHDDPRTSRHRVRGLTEDEV